VEQSLKKCPGGVGRTVIDSLDNNVRLRAQGPTFLTIMTGWPAGLNDINDI